MSNLVGADVGELRQLAATFNARAAQLKSIESQLSWRIQAAPWEGHDVSRFVQDWNTRHRRVILGAAASVTIAAQELLANAEQQEKASSAGGPSLLDLWNRGLALWAQKQKEAEQHQGKLREQLHDIKSASADEAQRWWNSLSDSDKRYLLQGKDPNTGLPLAYDLLKMQDKLPPGAVDDARKALLEIQKREIEVYSTKSTVGIEGRVGWVHGAVHISSEVTEYADGSATLTVSGDMGGGVNTPGGNGSATLTGETSRTYRFNSVEEAKAAQQQMINDLPPDDLDDISAMHDPRRYISDRFDAAASAHGATGHEDKVKGTFALEAKAKGADGSGASGKVELAYEQNLHDGTSTGTFKVSGKANLDLGDGAKFSGAGEVSMTVGMDADHHVDTLTLEAKGDINMGAEFKSEHKLEGLRGSDGSAGAQHGVQGSVKIQIDNSPENAALVKSYMDNVANGNPRAAMADMDQLYKSGKVTMQFDATSKSTINSVDIDNPAFAIKAGGSTETSVNLVTMYKAPHDAKFQLYVPAA